MRQFTLVGAFFALVAAVFCLWQYRFERAPEFPTLRLPELRGHSAMGPGAEWAGSEAEPKLVLRVDPANPRAVARLGFPEISEVGFLHVRFQIASENLVPGTQIWNDGRGIIEWHPAKGGKDWENDQFTSVRRSHAGTVAECVLRPESGSAIPALRVENLGLSGEMEFSLFEATVLRERAVWKYGRWLLMAAWIAWVAAWIGPVGKFQIIRPLLAGTVWLMMGLHFVVPGPWKILHPFGSPFRIGPEIENVQPVKPAPPHPGLEALRNPAASQPVALESVGKIPDSGEFTLRLKHYAANARPLLHSLLLFAPTLAMAFLVGRRKAVPPMMLFALAIELAQYSFGYGFDWIDIFDLFCDAAGIALGVAIYQKLGGIKLPGVAFLMGLGAEQPLPLEQ